MSLLEAEYRLKYGVFSLVRRPGLCELQSYPEAGSATSVRSNSGPSAYALEEKWFLFRSCCWKSQVMNWSLLMEVRKTRWFPANYTGLIKNVQHSRAPRQSEAFY